MTKEEFGEVAGSSSPQELTSCKFRMQMVLWGQGQLEATSPQMQRSLRQPRIQAQLKFLTP